MKRYKIECLECSETEVIQVDESRHQVVSYDKKLNTPFLSFRWRPDLIWGFLCKCGNDNRLSPKESDDFDNLVDGDDVSVKKIAASLLIPDEKQFNMIEV